MVQNSKRKRVYTKKVSLLPVPHSLLSFPSGNQGDLEIRYHCSNRNVFMFVCILFFLCAIPGYLHISFS